VTEPCGPILIVDDDDDIRDVLALALRVTGHAVETAADGLEAMERITGGLRPSLILLDMMMPRMDGETFLSALRSDPRHADIRVVLLSGHTAVRDKAVSLGTDGCLTKPIELDDLMTTVDRFAEAA
jgi:two-component system, chemotaxis family, chemotaxis protein CheY